jgi:hypothetical protein
MKKFAKCLFVIGSISAISPTFVLGQTIITFDENGNGFGPDGPLPFTIAPDPIDGINTLVYTLPFPAVVLGDVAFGQSNDGGDLLRFGGPNHNQVWFFSDLEPGELNPSLADVPQIPPASGINLWIDQETGPEGNNGLTYTPIVEPQNPLDYSAGFAPPNYAVTYVIISDGVATPEPRSLALAILGGWLLLLRRGRQVR